MWRKAASDVARWPAASGPAGSKSEGAHVQGSTGEPERSPRLRRRHAAEEVHGRRDTNRPGRARGVGASRSEAPAQRR